MSAVVVTEKANSIISKPLTINTSKVTPEVLPLTKKLNSSVIDKSEDTSSQALLASLKQQECLTTPREDQSETKIKLLAKNEPTIDPGNPISALVNLRGTRVPTDNDRDLTEFLGSKSPISNRIPAFLQLTLEQNNSDDVAPSPDLRVVMRRDSRGDKLAGRDFDLEEEDIMKLEDMIQKEVNDVDLKENSSRPDLIRPTRGLSQFALKSIKKNNQQDDIEAMTQENNLAKSSQLFQESATKLGQKVSKQKTWNKLANVFNSMVQFQREEVKSISDADIIHHEIDGFRLRKLEDGRAKGRINITKDDFTREAFEHMRTIKIVSECATVGSPKHFQMMSQLIKNDPRKFMIDHEDPDHLLNRANFLGQTPLYLAAKNGNLRMVRLLIENKANYNIVCTISKRPLIQETVLEVAVKWNHPLIVEYLLYNCEFDAHVLQKCYKIAKNENVKTLFRKQSKTKDGKKPYFGIFACLKV